jgi:hypothetical protein
MKLSNILAIVASVFLIALVAVLMNVAPAAAQRGQAVVAPVESAPRYQISAYASGGGDKHRHGYFVIDTVSGEIWHAINGGAPQKQDQIRQ